MKIERKGIEINGIQISYIKHIKKVKNVTLRISEEGEIIVVCNPFIPQEKIDSFVKEKIAWILERQRKVLQKQNRIYEDVNTQDYFYFYDQKLNILCMQSHQNGVRYDDENLYVYYKKKEDCHKNIVKFIRKKCEQDFMEVVHFYYTKMKAYGFAFPEVKYRNMKSRWGSCIPKKGQICLNTRLLHYPKAFMEYVVLHELVHFVEPNHSSSFYRVVAYYMPDYKDRIKLGK